MVKYFSIALIFLLIYESGACQSPFKAGLLGGITTTQIDGDGYAGFDKLGFTAGGFVNNTFNSNRWTGQMELLFVQKGSRRPPNPEKGVFLYQINLSYVEVPLLAKLKFGRIIYEAGLSYGQLINHREFDMSGELLYKPSFKKREFALNAGAGFFITEKISFKARIVRSILPVRDYVVLARFGFFGFVGGSYNTALLYTIRYQFGKGEKKEKKDEKKLDINKILKIE